MQKFSANNLRYAHSNFIYEYIKFLYNPDIKKGIILKFKQKDRAHLQSLIKISPHSIESSRREKANSINRC